MLTIRLHRIGKTNQPSYNIVVVDKRRSAAAGRFCEELGKINRVTKSASLNRDRIKYWMSKGAQASPAVKNLLISEKIIEGRKIAVHAKPKKIEAATAAAKPAAVPAPAAEAVPVQPAAATEIAPQQAADAAQPDGAKAK